MNAVLDVAGPSCHYNSQACIGGFEPTLQDMYRTNSPHGLSLNSAYVYGSLYDEEGGVYNYMRNIGPESLHVIYFYYKPPGSAFTIPFAANDFFLGMCVNRLRKDEIRVHSWKGIPGPDFSLRISPDRFRLAEEGKMEVTGERVGLAMNAYFPQRNEDVYYSSIIYEVEGRLMGKRVKGGLAWDQLYGPPGQNWQTMRFFQDVQYMWVSGINVYENGDKEMYHFTAGKGDWGLGFVTSKGEKILTMSRSVAVEFAFDENGDPKSALLRTGSEDWLWKGGDRCRFDPKSLNLPLIWAEGPTQRVGEQRKLVYGGGWFEAYPGHFSQ